METSLNMQILELENEVKQLRHEMERVTTERDRMVQENNEIGRDKSGIELDKSRLKQELKDIKFREARMLTEFSELEEENISLQKVSPVCNLVESLILLEKCFYSKSPVCAALRWSLKEPNMKSVV